MIKNFEVSSIRLIEQSSGRVFVILMTELV